MNRKIFDRTINCSCIKYNDYCKKCICYCHIPKWHRNIVWYLQEMKYIGAFVVVLYMAITQPFVSIYLTLINIKT